MSDSLQPHGLEHARLPCPSPTPGAYTNSCPSSWWCHSTISSSVICFSSRLQSFPASGSFPVSQFFTSGGQSVGVSASASVLPILNFLYMLGLPLRLSCNAEDLGLILGLRWSPGEGRGYPLQNSGLEYKTSGKPMFMYIKHTHTFFFIMAYHRIVNIALCVLCRMASLIAQLVKNPPVMQHTPVWFLGWEDSTEKGWVTHSSVLAWRIPWTV